MTLTVVDVKNDKYGMDKMCITTRHEIITFTTTQRLWQRNIGDL
jgi:hypothetical protein